MIPRAFLRIVGTGACASAAILYSVTANAQTITGFTADASGFVSVKIGANNVIDLFDGASGNLDPTKQNQLNGTNDRFDLVGNSTYSAIKVAQGTFSGSSAVAFSVRFSNPTLGSNGIKSGGLVVLLQNEVTVFGVGLGVASNGGMTLAPITSNAGTTFDASYRYTVGSAISTNTNRYTITQADSSIGGGADAWVTFVVLTSELSGISSGFSFTATTGVSAFTNSGGNGLGSSNINADYITSDNTPTGTLAFGSTSGTTAPVPEFPTAVIVGAVLLPMVGWRLWRRRRASAASNT